MKDKGFQNLSLPWRIPYFSVPSSALVAAHDRSKPFAISALSCIESIIGCTIFGSSGSLIFLCFV